jgi:hypothetical protein
MSSYSNKQVTEETTIESMMLPQLQNRLEKLQSDLANINLQRRKLGYSLSSKKLQRGYSDTQDKLKRTAVLKQSILDAISRTTLLIHAYENNQIVLTKTER